MTEFSPLKFLPHLTQWLEGVATEDIKFGSFPRGAASSLADIVPEGLLPWAVFSGRLTTNFIKAAEWYSG